MNGLKKKNLLTSWKEIAAYLDCDVRTCIRWEKTYGLPIKRLGKSPRSRVFAYVEELDSWMEERAKKNRIDNSKKPDPSTKSSIPFGWRPAVLAVIVLTLVLAVYLLFFNRPLVPPSHESVHLPEGELVNGTNPISADRPAVEKASQPADFKIDDSILIITDKDGRELFRFDTGIEEMRDEKYYRNHFKNKTYNIETNFDEKTLMKSVWHPHLIIRDLDRNGYNEVLFVPQTKSNLGEEILFCFDRKGEKLWECRTGRRLKFGNIEYPDSYGIDKLDTEDLDGDGREEVMLASAHRDDFPTQFLVLDFNGRKKGEYWNSGRMMDWEYIDIDRDGIKEIIVAAMNNESAGPALIVFDRNFVEGSSPQQKDFWTCKDLSPGREMYYVRFPSNLDLIFPHIMEGFYRIDIIGDDVIKVETAITAIIYYFDRLLTLKNIRLSHITQTLYREKYAEGVISEPFNHDKIAARLEKDIQYWDGDEWASSPVMNKYWRGAKK